MKQIKLFIGFVFLILNISCSSNSPLASENQTENQTENQLGTQRLPSSNSSFSDTNNFQKMDINRLKTIAFARCQVAYTAPVTEPVDILDPPKDGAPESKGMVYQEELAVKTSNLLDRDGFYFSPRPRAAVNTISMDIYVQYKNTELFEKKTWEDAHVDFSSPQIKPTILAQDIPAAGRVLTELIIGHRSPKGDYPQLFDLRSSAYFRFAGYPPQVTGASMRMGAHKIFGREQNPNEVKKEDFPVVRSIYASIKNNRTANALVLVENNLFCGAFSMDMTEGSNAEVVVDSYWYTRENFDYKKDPNTALVLYSSMFWQTDKKLEDGTLVKAHDSDTLSIKTSRGVKKYTIAPPAKGLRIRDVTQGNNPFEWSLSNEDRNPKHYAQFESALQNTNYNFRSSYRVSILSSNVKTSVRLYEQATDAEYGDNIVAASVINQDFKKSKTDADFMHFKYRTSSYFPSAH